MNSGKTIYVVKIIKVIITTDLDNFEQSFLCLISKLPESVGQADFQSFCIGGFDDEESVCARNGKQRS